MTMSQFSIMKAIFFLVVVSAHAVTASITWDGPVDAAIDQVAATLNKLGIKGAGVRPFGYGFEISPEQTPSPTAATGEEGAREAPVEEAKYLFEVGQGRGP